MKISFSSASHVFRSLAVALLLCGLMGAVTFAQGTTTRVTGSEKDPQGAVVTGATVTLTDIATGRSATATSNNDGFFEFPNVLLTVSNTLTMFFLMIAASAVSSSERKHSNACKEPAQVRKSLAVNSACVISLI